MKKLISVLLIIITLMAFNTACVYEEKYPNEYPNTRWTAVYHEIYMSMDIRSKEDIVTTVNRGNFSKQFKTKFLGNRIEFVGMQNGVASESYGYHQVEIDFYNKDKFSFTDLKWTFYNVFLDESVLSDVAYEEVKITFTRV